MQSLVKINLQFFAGDEKTEKATPKRRREAREKGQIFQSKEVNSAIIILSGFFILKVIGGYILDKLINVTSIIYDNYILDSSLFTIQGINLLTIRVLSIVAIIIGPIVGVLFISGLVVNYAQVGFLFTTKTLEIKLNRLNPIEGFKRILSKRSLMELLKSFIKIFIIGYTIYSYVINQIDIIFNVIDMSIGSIVKNIGNLIVNIGLRAGGVLIILAAFDYAYQWWDYEKNLKMSKQEIKEEFKQTEGNPQIKSKIKEKQRQIAMRRMMQDVPKADVIITNPTHYAIALKYDKEKYSAPYLLAKGKDLVAQNIKKVAIENNVPIVENKPLAQMLYKNVEINEVIPEELYQAVAEVLAYVYSLKG